MAHRWHARQCDGDWEHGSGVKIETLDNPGWVLRINLEDHSNVNESGEVSEEYDPTKVASWWVCQVEKKQFVSACGAHDLEAIISIFRDWAECATREQSSSDAR